MSNFLIFKYIIKDALKLCVDVALVGLEYKLKLSFEVLRRLGIKLYKEIDQDNDYKILS